MVGEGSGGFSAQTLDGKTAGRAHQLECDLCISPGGGVGVGKRAGGLYRDPPGSRRLVSSMCPRQATVEGAGGIGFSQALLLLWILGVCPECSHQLSEFL